MKSKTEAFELASIMNAELERLPDISFFGDDNSEEKELLAAWIDLLRKYGATSELPDKDDWPELYNWLTGEGSTTLTDYLS